MDEDTRHVERMKANIRDAVALREDFAQIRQDAHNDDKRRKTFVDKSAGEAIINGMKTHAADAGVQHYGCGALCNLSANVDNKVTLMKIGAGETIINAINNHKDNPNIQHYGCGALMSLSVNVDNKVKLMEIGAGESIINALNNHKDNKDVQKYGCGALINLSANGDNKVTLMKIGAGEAIINAMNNHKDNANIQHYGCGALCNLSLNVDNKVTLMKIGAGETIINAINNHRDNANVQFYGCGALCNLAVNVDNKVTSMKIGAGEAIINAMNNHKDNPNIQHYGCGALMSLSVNVDNKVTLMKIGAGEAIINAMNNHKDNPNIQHYGCGALWNLLVNNDNKVPLTKIGAGEAIINAMNNHKDNKDIQHYGCGALMSLSLNVDNKVKLMKIGAGEAIINALGKHKNNIDILDKGYSVLKCLADDAECKEILVNIFSNKRFALTMRRFFWKTLRYRVDIRILIFGVMIFLAFGVFEGYSSIYFTFILAFVIISIPFMSRYTLSEKTIYSLKELLEKNFKSNTDSPIDLSTIGIETVCKLLLASFILGIKTKHFMLIDILNEKSIDHLIEIGNGSRNDRTIQYYVCKSLYDCVLSCDSKEKLISIGEYIISVLENQSLGLDIHHFGLNILKFLILIDDDIRMRLIEMGMGDIIVNIIEIYKQSEEIQMRACETLKIVLDSDESILAALKKGLEFGLTDLIQSLNGDAADESLSSNMNFKVLQEIKLQMIKYETRNRLAVQQARECFLENNPKDTRFIDGKSSMNDDMRSIKHIIKKGNVLELTKSLYKLEESFDFKWMDINLYNLRLEMNKYANQSNEMKLNSQFISIADEIVKLDDLVSEMKEKLKKVNEIEKKLGNKGITIEKNIPKWELLIDERDKQRDEFIKLLNKYKELSNKRSQDQSNNAESEIAETEKRIMKLRNALESPSSSSSLLNNALEAIKSRGISLDGDLENDEDETISKVLSNIRVQSQEESKWFQGMKERFDEDDEKVLLINNTLDSINKLIELAISDIIKYNHAAKKRNDECSSQKAQLFTEIDRLIEEKNINEMESKKTVNDFIHMKHLKAMDYEQEIELHDRWLAINRLIEMVKGLSSKMKLVSKSLLKIQLDMHSDICEQDQTRLEAEKEELEKQMSVLKSEQNEFIERIMQLSKRFAQTSLSLSSSSSSSSANDDNHEQEYDFPEIPLLVLQLTDIKKSTTNKKSSQSQQEVKQLLIKSGFLIDRSLNDDYDFDDLPDDVMEIARSPEVINSSIRICKLKNPSTNQALSNTIKVLQGIDINDFKTVRGAVVLASRTRHSSILPIETVFIDDSSSSTTNKVYIQTPFRMGGSMKRWLSLKERSIGHKLDALSKIADGLDAVHIHGIVHRDIKLENIVMDSNDDVANPSICDFDTSRDVIGAFSMMSATTFGGIGSKKIGTIRYMAPEIFERGEKATKQSDVWSFVMMMLIALVYDGKYEDLPMKPSNRGVDRVDIDKSLSQAKQRIGEQYPTIMKLFEQVLGNNADTSQSRPKMSEIRDILLNADICECYLCKSEGIQPSYHRRLDGCECDGDDSNGNNNHFLCRHHFVRMIDAFARDGEVYCQECDGNNRKALNDKKILDVGGYESMKKVIDGREIKQREKMKIEMDKVRIDAERKGKEEGLKEAEKGLMNVEIARIRMEIENICIPKCPRCNVAIEHESGCAAMICTRPGCGCGFCGYCLQDCGENAYDHVLQCPDKGNIQGFGGPSSTSLAMQQRSKRLLLEYWNNKVDAKMKREAVKDNTIKNWLLSMQIPY